jgi:hypothetical protein
MNEITWRETEIIIQMWRDRAKEFGYKSGTQTYAKYEVEFFVGAMAMLLASNRTYPSIWNEIIQCGRSLSQTLLPNKEERP